MKIKITCLIFSLVFLFSCNYNKDEIYFKDSNKLSNKTKKAVSKLINYGAITGPLLG